MRLPIAIPLDSRDGTTDQDGALINAVVERYEDISFVGQRPGLSQAATVSGAAGGVVCFNGGVIAIAGLGMVINALNTPILSMDLDGNAVDQNGHETELIGGEFSDEQSSFSSYSYKTSGASQYINITPKTPDALAVGSVGFFVSCDVYIIDTTETITIFEYLATDFIFSIKIAVGGQLQTEFEDDLLSIGSSYITTSGVWFNVRAESFETEWVLYIDDTEVASIPVANYIPMNPTGPTTIRVGGGNVYLNRLRYSTTDTSTEAVAAGQYDFAQSTT